MFEEFKDKIPNFRKLVVLINRWLNGPSEDLEELKEKIFNHIIKEKGIDIKTDKEAVVDAEGLAFDIINALIENLEVNKLNYYRLKNYIEIYDDYLAYNRLIVDFKKFMSKEGRHRIISKGKETFERDLTTHWKWCEQKTCLISFRTYLNPIVFKVWLCYINVSKNKKN